MARDYGYVLGKAIQNMMTEDGLTAEELSENMGISVDLVKHLLRGASGRKHEIPAGDYFEALHTVLYASKRGAAWVEKSGIGTNVCIVIDDPTVVKYAKAYLAGDDDEALKIAVSNEKNVIIDGTLMGSEEYRLCYGLE